MGYTRLAVYIVGLLIVVMAAWVFLTQTPLGDTIPASIALAIILLLVGVGVMVAARNINDSTYRRRVVRDVDGVAPPPATRYYEAPAGTVERTRVVNEPATGETYVEERRYD